MWRLFLLLLLALLATYQKAWAQPVIHQPAVYTQCKEVPTPAGFLPPTGEQVVYCKLGGAGWCSMNASGVETCTGGSGGGGGVSSVMAGTGISLSPNPIIATGTVSLTIPVATVNGGTNQTGATNNDTLVGDGTNWQQRAIPDCHAAGNGLLFTAATNLFSCNTAITATNVPFSGILTGSNSTATMTVSSGGRLTTSGTGDIDGTLLDNGGAVINASGPAYGAKGDGVTDNCPAFGLINAAIPAGGARVVFGAGEFRSSCPLPLHIQSTYEGAGAGATIISTLATGTGNSLMQTATPRTCTGGTGTCTAAWFGGAFGAGCACHSNSDCNSGVCAGGTAARNITVRGFRFLLRVANSTAIDFGGISESHIEDNFFSVSTQSGSTDIVLSDDSGNIAGYDDVLSGNYIQSAAIGVWVMAHANGTRLTNNIVDSNAIGVQIDATTNATRITANNLQNDTTEDILDNGQNTAYDSNRWENAASHIVIGASATSVGLTSKDLHVGTGTKITNSGTGTRLDGILLGSNAPDCTISSSSACQIAANANTFYAGPTSGGSAAPTFRALVPGDLPAGDPLPQYLLLAGRSGGQLANGGTAAGDSLTLTGTANGTPTSASNVQINGPFAVTGTNPSATIAMVEFNAPNVTLTGNSQLVELYRGTTTVGSFATVRGLSPAHDCGANCGAHFTHQGPSDNGIELFTDDIHHWNQQNNSITTASTSYGEARTWVMDATAGHSPTFNLNDSLAHAINFGNHQTRYDVNGSCTCSVNADCGTGGTCTTGKCTAGAGATCIDSAGFCNTGGGFKCTSPGTPTGTVQHDTGLECGGPIAEIETGWTINHQTCVWHDSPAVVNGTLSDEIGMHLNLTKGTTRESLVSVDPGTTMEHAGGVEIGSSTTTPGVSNLAVTGTQTNTPLAKFDYTGSVTTAPVALALFPGNLSIGSGGGVQGLATGSAYTLTGNSSAFGLSNFFAFSPTIKNTTGTAETASGVSSFFANPLFEGDGAAFTNNTVIVDALDGLMFFPSFSTINGGTVTADNVVAVHVKTNVNAGATVTNLVGLKVDNPGSGGTLTNMTAIDLASLTTAGTNISLRSAGAATMRHAGNVRIGDTATAPTHALEVTQAANTSPIVQMDETGSVTAGITALRAFPSGLSLGASAGGIVGMDSTSTWTMSADPSAILLGQFVNFAPTITNSAAVHPKGLATFKTAPTFQANTTAITMASVGEDAFSGVTVAPTFNVTNAGTGTADTVTGLHAKATVSTGWTVTNYTPVKVDAPTVTGAITNLVGVDVAQLTQGTLNVGIRNAATTANPMAAQSFGVSSTLAVNATFIGVTATAASLTITLPTTNINDGTRIVIINAGATNTFTLATIAQGNLTMAVAGAANSTAEVIWSSTLAKWLKLSQA